MTTRQLKAAVYTRKSTEHGLEQDFNSLAAQREAGEAYIKSQRSEGWVLVDKAYDDGGISGATVKRPALQQLLHDIDAGRIDIIVVYKVDRLTRCLSDFALIIKRLDAAGASFVSVTQQFNTSNSMGRLTLNVLLSFAQFEREVTAERIRDKVDASKKKGIWMGGVVPLGYDNTDKKLTINESEAVTVRLLFKEYLLAKSVDALKDTVNARGLRTKKHAGQKTSGKAFGSGTLYYILKNPLYIGKIHHKGTCYAGCHKPLIDLAVWQQVQDKLIKGQANRNLQTNAGYPSLLTGLLVNSAGTKFTPSHANKKGKRYRYYISGEKDCSQTTERYPAEQSEVAVKNALINWLEDDINHINSDGPCAQSPAPNREATHQKRSGLSKNLKAGTPHEQLSAIRSLVKKITLSEGGIQILLDPNYAATTNIETAPQDPIELKIDIVLRKGIKGKKIIVPSQRQNIQKPDQKLVQLIANAHRWAKSLQSGKFATIEELAHQYGVDKAGISKQVRLAYLAPDIIQAIFEGRQPPLLKANHLRRLSTLPTNWDEQRKLLGFS